ncbi:MAG: hydrolase 1, exosortase A system-associated [Proteobacteria bacterium]|nr:hydrolase 1, exosortase A system-associated [Pseudomonadota bacterium]
MNSPAAAAPRPMHLAGSRGALFALYYPPQGAPSALGDLLVVQSFGEELNRCRAMVALQARELARQGIGTLVLDAWGTGDSGGEYRDGSWELWADDLKRGVAWLRRSGQGCRALWGIRLGAIMAVELAAQDPQIDQLLLWQPVTEGRSFFTQFLRIRIAAELQQAGGIRTTEELRQRSGQGEDIEVSGFQVSPKLAADLDRIRWPAPATLRHVQVGWFETLAAADASVSRTSLKAIEALKAGGVQVALTQVTGPAFWQLHERFVAPELISACREWCVRQAQGLSATPAAAATIVADDQPATAAADAGQTPVVFDCAGEKLLGIIHQAGAAARRGVVIAVAGGPQYRAGAHRQFVTLARKLAARGFPVLRFDLRGMGDSTGEHRGFQDSLPDLRAAVDALLAQQPQLEQVVLFGECESASGILFYAWRDPRVAGLALVNPWVRTEGVQAEAIIKHYYSGRLLQPDFWRKLVSGGINPLTVGRDFMRQLRAFLRGRRQRGLTASGSDDMADLPLPVKTAEGLRRFPGPVMILMSGRDLIAREFDEVVKSTAAWQGLLQRPQVLYRELQGADHTFSRQVWKDQAAQWVGEWLGSW